MKLYGYCVALNDKVGSITVDGVEGIPVETLVEGDLVALVSGYHSDRVPVTRSNVLQHEKVVRAALEISTPLPFRFGTLLTSGQLSNYLKSRSDSLKAKLVEVNGCVEMNIKIIWNPPYDSSTTNEQPLVTGANAEEGGQGRGARFLLRKRDKFLGEEKAGESAETVRTWIDSSVRPFTKAQLINVKPENKLVLSGAYLVSRDHLEAFRVRVNEIRQERPELKFLLSGPWAPYTFSNIDLEFQLQIGVS